MLNLTKDTDNFYLSKEEPNKSCLLAMRSIILAQDRHITETVKYGMPCFCYRNKILCYLWIDKKTLEPYMLMADGKQLSHPQLEQGARSKMKIFRVNSEQDLPVDTIKSILTAAIMYSGNTMGYTE